MTTALILRDPQLEVIQSTPELDALIEKALTAAAPITRVTNAEEHEKSVAAQNELRDVIRLTEKAGKEFRSVLEAYQRKELDFERKKLAEAQAESVRLCNLDVEYVEEQRRIVREAELARVMELQRIEREKQAALAVVETPAQREAVVEHFQERAAIAAPTAPLPLPQVAGQIIGDVWEYEVTDLKLLAAASDFLLVKVEPKRREILAALSAGVTVEGIRAWKQPKAKLTSRTREPQAIEV